MTDHAEEQPTLQEVIGRLLARGGQPLALAALAKSRGQRAGQGPWYGLSGQLKAAAEELLFVLDQEPDPHALELALRAAMDQRPATAAPSWIAPLGRVPDILEKIGAELDDQLIAPALGSSQKEVKGRERGLAGLAVAFSRSLDTRQAVAERLESSEDRELFLRMGCLAQVNSGPGQPTKVRARIKLLLRKEANDG